MIVNEWIPLPGKKVFRGLHALQCKKLAEVGT